MNAEDVKAIHNKAEQAKLMTETVCTSSSVQEIDAHLNLLDQADDGLREIEHWLKRERGQLTEKIDAVKNAQKSIKWHRDACKRRRSEIRDDLYSNRT